jgi:hypothetical protein
MRGITLISIYPLPKSPDALLDKNGGELCEQAFAAIPPLTREDILPDGQHEIKVASYPRIQCLNVCLFPRSGCRGTGVCNARRL